MTENICRTCLSQDVELINVIDNHVTIDNESETLSHLLEVCTSIEVKTDNEFSTQICTGCEEKLVSAYKFRQQALKSDECLRNRIRIDLNQLKVENPTNIKDELKDSSEPGIDNDEFLKNDENCHDKRYVFLVDTETVNLALTEVAKQYKKKCQCRLCGFICHGQRGLSLHITHAHAELKNRWCPICYIEVDDLKVHRKCCERGRRYTCKFCEKIFTQRTSLNQHILTHSENQRYTCSVCKKGFSTPRALRIHMRIHTGEKPFSCTVCQRRFTQSSALRLHELKHKGQKVYRCELRSCSSKFYKLEYLQKHLKKTNHGKSQILNNDAHTVRDDPNPLNNEDCKIKRESEDIKEDEPLYIAKEINDSEQLLLNQSKCYICDKTYGHSRNLRNHMRIHTGAMAFSCEFCEKKFAIRSKLMSHLRTHTGERPHVCHVCGKGFGQRGSLSTHLKQHTGRTEQCHICQQKFCRPAELTLHMRKHTGEKPYLCNECGMRFIQVSHLTEHRKRHSDERPFSCEYCQRAFKHKSTLTSHVQIHTGEKPFQCTHCAYRCRQSYRLQQHMRQHLNKPSQPTVKTQIKIEEPSLITDVL